LSSYQVLLTLFIGIVATSMEEAKAAYEEEKDTDKRLQKRIDAMNFDEYTLPLYNAKNMLMYREVFSVVGDGALRLTRDQMKKFVLVLAAVRKVSI